MEQLYGAIEAGGTKFVCMVGTGPDQVIEEIRYPTTRPDETIQRAIDFFEIYSRQEALVAIGIASFGPVDLNPSSKTYGYITTTPKPYWNHIDLLGRIQQAIPVPIAFETDVNAAAFGEHYWVSSNRSLDPLLYMTVGTGIGVGVFANGNTVHGLIHTEAGHLAIPHDRQVDPFPGNCPYHGDCLEGLAAGPSIAERWGMPAEKLPDGHPAWELEAGYIALAIANLIYAISPQRIVVGGGVMEHPGLLEATRDKVQQHLNGYIQSPMVLDNIHEYIVAPALKGRSGVLGAIAMGINIIRDR